MLEDMIELARQWGPFLLFTIVHLYRDYRREERMSDRINQLENKQQEIVLPLVKECAEVIEHNSVVIQRLEKYLES